LFNDGYSTKEEAMKRTMIWGLGLVLAAVVLWWGFQGTGQASHNPSAGYSHNNYLGGPHDGTSDSDDTGNGSERTGFDRHADRTPDGDGAGAAAANDRGGPDGANDGSGVPDCVNGPGDGDSGSAVDTPCGHPRFTGDNVRDYNGPGDGRSDSSSDNGPASGFDRAGEGSGAREVGRDASPEHTNSDKYRLQHGLASTQGDRVGNRDCLAADVAVGECDRNIHLVNDSRRDRVGRDGNTSASDWNTGGAGDGTTDRVAADIAAGFDDPGRPARDGDGHGGIGVAGADDIGDAAGPATGATDGSGNSVEDTGSSGNGTSDQIAEASSDSTPDASQDRGNLRDAGYVNHSSPSRDAYPTGPSDRTHDEGFGEAGDKAGFGFGGAPSGGGGNGGCSMVAGTSAKPASGIAYLLVLLTPAALVVIRRKLRRK
jgi:hypothetical protein